METFLAVMPWMGGGVSIVWIHSSYSVNVSGWDFEDGSSARPRVEKELRKG